MSEPMVHYLLVFDHDAGELTFEKLFDDSDAAVAAYTEMEKKYEHRQRVEVVLIGSDSLDTIRRTHANYFDGSVSLTGLLAGL